jgi:hypothetical protein
MTNEQLEIARGFVECGRWRWMPGMLDTDGGRIVDPERLMTAQKQSASSPVWLLCGPLALPDITDPATLGCIVQVVRDARGQPCWLPTYLDPIDEAWVIEPPSHRRQTRYESYAAVLLAALQAAPGATNA